MASPSPVYGLGGTCGWQHNNTKCVPQQERSCCSANGFCGSNETYCFTRYDCQSSCVDPPAFYLNSSPAPTVTATATATASPAPTSSLTSKQKTGIIVGALLFAFFIILAILIWLYKRSKIPRPRPATPPGNQMIVFTHTEPNGVVNEMKFPQPFANDNPQLVERGAIMTGDGQMQLPWRGLHRFAGRRANTNAQYGNDPDDDRVHDVSSETS